MLNNFYGLDERKAERFGKISTIDFDLAPAGQNLAQRKQNALMGTLHLGGKETKLTVQEVEFLIETLQRAQRTYLQKYRFGN